ncbi:MAG: CoA transferase [Alphaproteobacteria bacterium]|nr:CoA transferase [Alphaproteobacteria bacterium]
MLDFLDEIRVVDISQYVPGPYASLQLADMGADVVKVEPPAGDPMRTFGAVDSDGISPLYKVVNGGKTVVRVDLKSDEGKTVFENLIAAADVLVESFRPGVLERLGFGRERLRVLNPALVYCALSGWGQTGPYRHKAGHDLNYMALGGGLVASGTRERPVMAWPPTADYASGVQAAAAICGALARRARTGAGAFIDTSLADTVLAWQSGGLTAAQRPEIAPRRAGNPINGGAACYQIYRTRDGRFLTLGNLEEKFWVNFAIAAGRPEWGPRQWEPMPQEDLIAEVQSEIEKRSLAEWEAILDKVDTCFQAALEFSEIPDHPHVRARALARNTGSETEPRVEVSFPAIVDDRPPPARPPVRELSATAVVERWRSGNQ